MRVSCNWANPLWSNAAVRMISPNPPTKSNDELRLTQGY